MKANFKTQYRKKIIPFFPDLKYGALGVKIRKLKVDFKTGGTWRWVGQ